MKKETKSKEKYSFPLTRENIPHFDKNGKIDGLQRTDNLFEIWFKRQYPQRKSIKRFWYLRTDEYQKFGCLDWLPDDKERIAALNEIKEEVVNTLSPKNKKKTDILEWIDWEINSLQYLSRNTTQSEAVTLPDKFAATDVRAALDKAVKAGYLDGQYQPIGELVHTFGRFKGDFYKSRLAAFATAMNKIVDMSLSYPDFQRLWKIDKGQLYQNSLTNSKDYIKYQSIFESLFK